MRTSRGLLLAGAALVLFTTAFGAVSSVFPPALTAVQSRKAHGAAGTFDIPIDHTIALSGPVAVEPRAIGAGHLIVFQFDVSITVPGTPTVVDENSAPVGSAVVAASGNEVRVTVTGVPDNKRVKVTLTGVNSLLTVSASLGVLVGDVDGSRSVTSADIVAVQGSSGQAANGTNFRRDVNASGAVTASDILLAKGRLGLVLPGAVVCGDGVMGGGELCDDGNLNNGDGCSSNCQVEAGYSCSGSPSVCSAACGNGVVGGGEACDDGNLNNGDGCSSICQVEAGYACSGSPSVCSAACGNGVVGGGEACDDGNLNNGDGCSSICQVEAGYSCSGSPSVCVTGACAGQPNGTPCDVGDLCTVNSTCQAGICSAGSPVVCPPLDECHASGVCNPGTGSCSNPDLPNGTPCSTGTCNGGTCQ